MSLLVDACVWSLSFRRRPGTPLTADQKRLLIEFEEAIAGGRVSIIGAVRQEVLSGIRDKSQFLRTRQALEPFHDEEVVPNDYPEAARLFNLCLDRGVQCGSIDMLICAVAVRRNLAVLTYDKALMRCLNVLAIPHL
jgi:predicted nucleic acid-binding protein